MSKLVLSMVVYFAEVTVSGFMLGRVLGFSRAFSFAAGLWLVILFFPPLNPMFGLQGVRATSPQWGNTPGHLQSHSHLISADRSTDLVGTGLALCQCDQYWPREQYDNAADRISARGAIL